VPIAFGTTTFFAKLTPMGAGGHRVTEAPFGDSSVGVDVDVPFPTLPLLPVFVPPEVVGPG
jgi:hypothetical protein